MIAPTNGGAGLEGRIRIRVALRAQRVQSVAIDSTRLTRACRILEGKPVEEALHLLPRMFSLCGVAQASAGQAACNMAQDVTPGGAALAQRELWLKWETAHEHLQRLLLEWPALFLGRPPELAGLMRVRRTLQDFKSALGAQPDGSASAPMADYIDALEEQMSAIVFGLPPARWLELRREDELDGWYCRTASLAARVLAHIRENGLMDFGRSVVIRPLPDIAVAEFDGLLAPDVTGEFAAKPSWHGQVYETGALARQQDHPLIQDLQRYYGNGLITRLTARLVELARVPQEMRALTGRIRGRDETPAPRVESPLSQDTGIGVVEAARGRLVHRVELRDGIVQRYQILAPTEWNFHPDGPLVQGLYDRVVENREDLQRQTGMLVTALDPCVAHEVIVED